MMFSLTILLYALVCNTIIGCLLEQDKKQGNQHPNIENFPQPLRIRPLSESQKSIKTLEHRPATKKQNIDYKQMAVVVNMFGKWFFALSVLAFNAAFWTYSISQYLITPIV